jgi:hypothetical protein
MPRTTNADKRMGRYAVKARRRDGKREVEKYLKDNPEIYFDGDNQPESEEEDFE